MPRRSCRVCLGWLVLACAPATATAERVRGAVVDARTSEPLVGATVVASGGPTRDAMPVITEEDGAYELDIPPGSYVITAYYGDVTLERRVDVLPDRDVLGFVLNVHLDDPAAAVVATTPVLAPGPAHCHFDLPVVPPPPLDELLPGRRDATLAEVALLRRRDGAGLLGLDPRVDPARAAAVLDRAYRVPGAPPVALELLGSHVAWTDDAPIHLAGASGGVASDTLKQGTRELEASANLRLGRLSRLAATAGAPITHDDYTGTSWSSGLVLEQQPDSLAGQAMGSLLFKRWRRASVISALADLDGDRSDVWVQALMVAWNEDTDPQFEIGLVGERFDAGSGGGEAVRASGAALPAPRVVERVGGRLVVHRQPRWHGLHELSLGGELGGGRADDVAHGDVRVFAGDRWTPRPSLLVQLGARWDRRTIGETAVELVSPRLAITWASREWRHVLFASAERTGRLDEQAFGAWRDGATNTDTATAGYLRTWRSLRLWTGLRAAVPRAGFDERPPPQAGVEGGASWERDRWRVETIASSLARAATFTARWAHRAPGNHASFAAIARATADDIAWGASATLRHVPDPDDGHDDSHPMSVGVEAFDLDDPATRSAHLTISAAW